MAGSIYNPLWEQLKNNPDVPLIIAAHPAHHRRIYKAIIKRKDEDTVFKWILDEKGLRSKLSRTSEAGALKITLSFSLTVEGLFK